MYFFLAAWWVIPLKAKPKEDISNTNRNLYYNKHDFSFFRRAVDAVASLLRSAYGFLPTAVKPSVHTSISPNYTGCLIVPCFEIALSRNMKQWSLPSTMLNCHELRVVQPDPVKIQNFQEFSKTEIKFQDFQGLENKILNFKGFWGIQGPVCTQLT